MMPNILRGKHMHVPIEKFSYLTYIGQVKRAVMLLLSSYGNKFLTEKAKESAD